MAMAAVAVILSAGIAAAGPRFITNEAKGGLPVCMDKLNVITANLETCETNLVQAQEEFALQQTDLETCNMDLDQLLVDLAMSDENDASSSPVIGVPKTGQIFYSVPGDDGDLQKGTAWPDPRFTDNGDGTVTDNMTGLVWSKNANMFVETQTWYAAMDACAALADNGIDRTDGSQPGDWRLPNVKELQSLMDYGQSNPVLPVDHPFLEVQSSSYWTSTTYALSDYFSWGISLSNGYNAPAYYKNGNNGFIWCVRDGL
jgi:hypothetical protein